MVTVPSTFTLVVSSFFLPFDLPIPRNVKNFVAASRGPALQNPRWKRKSPTSQRRQSKDLHPNKKIEQNFEIPSKNWKLPLEGFGRWRELYILAILASEVPCGGPMGF